MPIDSETVKRFRNKVEALEAEKELFLVLIRYAVRLDDEENALGGINDMLMGEYSIGKNVKSASKLPMPRSMLILSEHFLVPVNSNLMY